MTYDFASAMRRATELVRAGDTDAATRMIQAAVGGSAPTGQDAPLICAPQVSAARRASQPSPARGLGKTLADLAARLPVRPASPLNQPEPPLTHGARFDRGTYRCAAGSRDYRVYIPNLGGARPAGMIVMLHGCTQSAEDFAVGTGMNRLADEHGLIIAYPNQSRGANMQSCWNWFAATDQQRDAGEPAILAGLARQLAGQHDIPAGRVFVAGLSAGAAMAVILGHTNPEIFAAVGAHSGLAYRSAHDMPSAFAAMAGARQTHASSPAANSYATPTIVFHGTADKTVVPANGQQIADGVSSDDISVIDKGSLNGRSYERETILSSEGYALLEYWKINGLGHAWSGGQMGGSYTDPAGPDASAEMVRFFLNAVQKGDMT